MPAIKLYNDVDGGTFCVGPTNANPIKFPLDLVQGSTVEIDVYFVRLTGDPLNPYIVLDPSLFSDIVLWIGNVLTGTLYVNVTGTISSDSFGQKVVFYAALTAATIATDMGLAEALAAILEVDFVSGYTAPKSQLRTRIARSTTTPTPTPPSPSPYAVGKYSQIFGDGSNNQYTINHNLNTTSVSVSVTEVATGEFVTVEQQIIDANNIKLIFGSVVGLNTYNVIIFG